MMPASQTSLAAFLSINACVVLALGVGVFHSYRRFEPQLAFKKTRVIVFWVLVWLATFMAIVETGFAKEHPMPGIPMLFLLGIVTSIAFAFSPIGTKLSKAVPLVAKKNV